MGLPVWHGLSPLILHKLENEIIFLLLYFTDKSSKSEVGESGATSLSLVTEVSSFWKDHQTMNCPQELGLFTQPLVTKLSCDSSLPIEYWGCDTGSIPSIILGGFVISSDVLLKPCLCKCVLSESSTMSMIHYNLMKRSHIDVQTDNPAGCADDSQHRSLVIWGSI